MKFYTRKRRPPNIILVSLIDILTILLIFFIATTTFKKDHPSVVINLPESKTAVEAPNEGNPIVLTITPEENIFLDAKEVEVGDLASAVRELIAVSPERSLAMRADKQASFGLIIQVLDALKEAGVKNLPAFTQAQK